MRISTLVGGIGSTALALVVHAQTVTNGSMTGTPVIGTPPPGWNSINTDGDTVGPGGLSGWATGIAASPNGGTFLMVLDNNGFGSSDFDKCGQTVSGFSVGAQYKLSFYYANGGLDIGNYAGPLKIEATVFGANFDTPTTLFDGFGSQTWRSIDYTFTASATSTNLLFRSLGQTPGIGAGGAVDGVAITLVPAPGALAVLGLAGLISRRRR